LRTGINITQGEMLTSTDASLPFRSKHKTVKTAQHFNLHKLRWI